MVVGPLLNRGLNSHTLFYYVFGGGDLVGETKKTCYKSAPSRMAMFRAEFVEPEELWMLNAEALRPLCFRYWVLWHFDTHQRPFSVHRTFALETPGCSVIPGAM